MVFGGVSVSGFLRKMQSHLARTRCVQCGLNHSQGIASCRLLKRTPHFVIKHKIITFTNNFDNDNVTMPQLGRPAALGQVIDHVSSVSFSVFSVN